MTSDSDKITESLIEDLRPRLCGLIAVQQVLDHLHILGADQKEKIRQKEATDGNLAAAHLLLDVVTKRPREEGWFQAFVDALEQSGCGHAADYIQVKLPDPEVEAENDYYVKLVQLMVPSLVDMKTETVCVHCASKDLITDADREIVSGLCQATAVRQQLSARVFCVHFPRDHFAYIETRAPSGVTSSSSHQVAANAVAFVLALRLPLRESCP